MKKRLPCENTGCLLAADPSAPDYVFVKAFQLFQAMSPQLAADVFRSLRENSREIYKGALISLANERRLRPVFIQRKSVDAQIDWLVKTVKLKSSDGAAEHILQIWLLKCHKDLLVDFLDAVGVPHDGDGSVEELPDELDAQKVGPAIDKLLETRSPELVATYLWMFQTQKPGGWPPLTVRLHEDPRLRFGAAAVSEEKEESTTDETEPDSEPEPAAASTGEPEEA